MGNPSYSQDDVQQILRLAIIRQTQNQDDLSRDQLLEIAEDMHISPSELAEAERLWLIQKDQLGMQQQFDQHRQQRFQQKAIKYGIVTGFVMVIDCLVGGGLGFSLYVAAGLGLGLAMAGRRTYGLQGEEYEQRFRNWRRRRALKQSVDGLVSRVLPFGDLGQS